MQLPRAQRKQPRRKARRCPGARQCAGDEDADECWEEDQKDPERVQAGRRKEVRADRELARSRLLPGPCQRRHQEERDRSHRTPCGKPPCSSRPPRQRTHTRRRPLPQKTGAPGSEAAGEDIPASPKEVRGGPAGRGDCSGHSHPARRVLKAPAWQPSRGVRAPRKMGGQGLREGSNVQAKQGKRATRPQGRRPGMSRSSRSQREGAANPGGGEKTTVFP